jgi:hypothetical protein
MLDYPIDPPIEVKDSRRLASINEARAFADEMLAQRRFSRWRAMLDRLDSVSNEEEAIEAIGGLRKLLQIEHLLAA